MVSKQLVIVGAGPAGIAAAIGAHDSGIDDIVIIEREKYPGGILNQCIHDGFGTIRYNETLTGPEYADRILIEVKKRKIEIITNSMVVEMNSDRIITVVSPKGLVKIQAKSVIFSTGCRERTRANIRIPGARPAGIFTAGVAQQLVNTLNILPGKRVVILGSGDIGLIMARRLTLEGANVLGVYEIQSKSGGLQRNIKQCLCDFGIPLYLKHTVTKINGKKRLESIVVEEVDDYGNIIPGTASIVECDTLILSVGLIPENDILKGAGATLRCSGSGMYTDEYLQTSISGVFLCGNARRVLDLVDFVSEEGEAAGRNAGYYLQKKPLIPYVLDKSNIAPKGVPHENVTNCIICPRGCELSISKQNGNTVVNGNMCPKGEKYAIQEIINPKRVVTTTVKDKSGKLLPVKTKEPVSINDIHKVMEMARRLVLEIKDYKDGEKVYSSDDYTLIYAGNTWRNQ